MKNVFAYMVLLPFCFPLALSAQPIVVNHGIKLIIESEAQLYIPGDFRTLQNISGFSGPILLNGKLQVDGDIEAGPSTFISDINQGKLTLGGINHQMISGETELYIPDLILKGGPRLVTFGSKLNVNQLDFFNENIKIYHSAAAIQMLEYGSFITETDDSRIFSVDGNVTSPQDYFLSSGAKVENSFGLGLGLELSADQSFSDFVISRNNQSFSGVGAGKSIEKIFKLSSTQDGEIEQVIINYFDSEINGLTDKNRLRLFQSYDDGISWLPINSHVQSNNQVMGSEISINANKSSLITLAYDCLPSSYSPEILSSIQSVNDTIHICEGDSILLQPVNNYQVNSWYFNESLISDSIQISAHQEGNYRLEVITQTGCIFNNDVYLQIHEQPESSFTISEDPDKKLICEGSDLNIKSEPNSFEDPIMLYSWVINGDTLDGTNVNLTNVSSGQKTIQHWVVSEYKCKSPIASQEFNILSRPTASIHIRDSLCEGSFFIPEISTSFSDGSNQRPLSFIWHYNDSTFLNKSPKLWAGKDTLSLFIEAIEPSLGCNNSLSKFFKINPKPHSSYQIISEGKEVTEICKSQSLEFEDLSSIEDGSQLIQKWIINGSYQQDSVFIDEDVEGEYKIELITSSLFGCTNTSVKNLMIHPVPEGVFSIDQLEICSGDSLKITNYSKPANSLNLDWDYGDGSFSQSAKEVHFHQFNKVGIFPIQLTRTNEFECSNAVIKQIKVHSKPVVDFINPDSVCQGEEIFFQNKSYDLSGESLYHFWNIDNGEVFQSNSKNIRYKLFEPGVYKTSLEVKSAFGCESKIVKNIVISPKPSFQLDIPIVSCESFHFIDPFSDSNASLEEAEFNWYQNGQLYSNQPEIEAYNTGLYSAHLDNGFCENEIHLPVFIVSKPVFSSDTLSFCGSGLIEDKSKDDDQLNISYEWYKNDSIVGHGKSLEVFESGNYRLLKSYNNGENNCTNFRDVFVIIDNIKNVAINDEYFLCQGDSLELNVEADQVHWTSSITGEIFSEGSRLVIENEKLITLEWQSGICKSSKEIKVKFHDRPVPFFEVEKNSFCSGESIKFLNRSTDFKSVWNFGDGKTDTTYQPVHSYDSAGRYPVSLTIESEQGCVGVYDRNIRVFNTPAISLEFDEVCQYDSITLFNSITGVLGDYLWDFGNKEFSREKSPIHAYQSAGIFEVNLTIENAHCRVSESAPLNVLGISKSNFRDTVSTCADEYLLSIEGADSVFWYHKEKFIGSNSQIVDESGSYRVVVKGEEGCLLEDEFYLVLNNQLEIDFRSDSIEVCDGIILDPGFFPKAKYRWSTGSNEQEISVNNTGSYNVIIEDQNGCENEANIFIEVNKTPKFDLPKSIDACEGDSIQIVPSIDVTGTYLWSSGEKTSSIITNEAGVYTLSSYNGSCEYSDQVEVVYFEKPKALFDVSKSCQDQELEFKSFSDSKNDYSYTWKFGDGSISRHSMVRKKYNEPGEFIVSLNIVSDKGCIGNYSDSLTVFPLPDANFNIIESCEGQPVAFLASNLEEDYSYYWDIDGATLAGSSVDQIFHEQGNFKAFLNVEDDNGCIGSGFREFSVLPVPVVGFPDEIMVCDSAYYLSSGLSNVSFEWSNGSSENGLWISQSGVYSLLATNDLGCSAMDTVNVILDDAAELLFNDTFSCGSFEVEIPEEQTIINWSGKEIDGSYLAESTAEYSITYINENLCLYEKEAYIEIGEIPKIDIENYVEICEGTEQYLDVFHPDVKSVLWSTGEKTPSIQPYETGIYSFVLTGENGCEFQDSVYLVINKTPFFELSEKIHNCGSLLLESGLEDGVNFEWSNGQKTPDIIVNESGPIWLKASNSHGCFHLDSSYVSIFPPAEINLGPDITLCHNQTFTLSINPEEWKSYEWSTHQNTTEIFINQPGKYWVSVLDANGCLDIDTIEVTYSPEVDLGLAKTQFLCQDEVILSIESEKIKKIRWFDDSGLISRKKQINVQNEGMYWVNVEDVFGCYQKDSVDVFSTTESIEASFLMPSIAAVGDLVHFSLLTSPVPDVIEWNFLEGAFSNVVNPTYRYLEEGIHEVLLRISNGVCSDSLIKEITIESFLDEDVSEQGIVSIQDLSIYPNPFNDSFLVDVQLNQEADAVILVYDLTGFLVLQKQVKLKEDQVQLVFDNLKPGTYLMYFQAGNQSRVLRILKSH